MIEGRDLRWLDAAARIAMPFRGTTAENPTVGAIIVDGEGVMRGRGVTAPGGRPHAETRALEMAGEAARGATLYVTLEPCAHWGRTPPCVDAVLAAGIGRVVIGAQDPDPRTVGASIKKLEAAGVPVILAKEHAPSRFLHEGFLSRHLKGRPFVTAKLAVSRDGMIGAADEGNVAITGEVAGRWTHMQRALSDAVLVGAATARIDNPRLTVRLAGLEDRKPLRVVIAGREKLPADLTLFATAEAQPTAVIVEAPPEDVLDPNVKSIIVSGIGGRPDLGAALAALAALGIGSVLVEGGAVLTEALLAAGLVDRFHLLDADLEIGPGGVPASPYGPLRERLAAEGFSTVDRRTLGCDRLHSFERPR